jgi:hypothetical protein
MIRRRHSTQIENVPKIVAQATFLTEPMALRVTRMALVWFQPVLDIEGC